VGRHVAGRHHHDSGQNQAWVAAFPAGDRRRQISADGGSQPQWRRDDKELYFLGLDAKLMVVDMRLGPATVDSSAPRVLFDAGVLTNAAQDQYRASPDGTRFLLLRPVASDSRRGTPLEIVVNWTSALQRPTR
jgi:hypothetical protein